MTVTFPPDTEQRISEGAYPDCGHCRGYGVTYRPNRRRTTYEPESHIEDDCRFCYGTGVRIPLTDILIDGARPCPPTPPPSTPPSQPSWPTATTSPNATSTNTRGSRSEGSTQ